MTTPPRRVPHAGPRVETGENPKCSGCNGTRKVPVPTGMSAGFYAFMGAGCHRDERGGMWMVCPRCDGTGSTPTETAP